MQKIKTVALVGAPNAGKTTLYNWLTKSQFRTVNYAGSTVEFAVGHLRDEQAQKTDVTVIDTPGIYSLKANSLDEEVTSRILFDSQSRWRPDFVLVVVDGTSISRQLLIAEALKKSGYAFALVFTMRDLLKKSDMKLEMQKIKDYFGCSCFEFDGTLGAGLNPLISFLTDQDLAHQSEKVNYPLSSDEIRSFQNTYDQFIQSGPHQKNLFNKRTNQIDRFLLHPLFGFVSFFVIMSSLFGSIFWLAAPLMDLIDSAFSGVIQGLIARFPQSLWVDFLANGLLASISGVLIFTPQIFILFLGLGILESSGYLARAAILIDKPLSLIGLSGRSFVPLLSGFACAIPAMMATRSISDPKERWLTRFIVPMMSCSARIPVYSLLIAFLLPEESAWKQGILLALIYIVSTFLGALTAGILSKFILLSSRNSLMMELPLYRRPLVKLVMSQSLSRTKSYIVRAGPIILIIALLIWFASNFPRADLAVVSSPEISESYLGMAGRFLEPLFAPLGLDWRVGIGLLSAFAAREVFVGTLALVFQTTLSDEGIQSGLLAAMKTATNARGEPLFTFGSVIGLIFFFMIALQCMSTFAISVKESGSYRFAIAQLLALNFAAYLLAWVCFQVSIL